MAAFAAAGAGLLRAQRDVSLLPGGEDVRAPGVPSNDDPHGAILVTGGCEDCAEMQMARQPIDTRQGLQTQVEHSGSDCWEPCGNAGGKCKYCGTGGACCHGSGNLFSDPPECRGLTHSFVQPESDGQTPQAPGGFHSCVRVGVDQPSAPKIALVVSTQRGASTAVAEIVGSHPCGASFNEMLVREHFPTGYDKYKSYKGGIRKAINEIVGEQIVQGPFQHKQWLQDAVRVRDRFCDARPRPVKDHCGDTCVVALKMHLNNFIAWPRDPQWIELLTSPVVSTVMLQRGGVENYCSILASTRADFWGHNPSERRRRNPDTGLRRLRARMADEIRSNCLWTNSTKANDWARTVEHRFDVARQVLRRSSLARPWLDLTFERFIAAGGGDARSPMARKVLDHVGLGDPGVWDTCGLGWCARRSWPWPPSNRSAHSDPAVALAT